jgi:hypothetical protein
VEARIEMTEPGAALSEPQPQGAGSVTFAREHDARNIHLDQPARQAQFLRARCKIDEKLRQFREQCR